MATKASPRRSRTSCAGASASTSIRALSSSSPSCPRRRPARSIARFYGRKVETMERSFPKITEEGLDALRQRIGVKIGQTAEPWCHEATRDNIRHYAHGIGDDNPLWCVPEYAKKTKFGDVIALPSFLFTTSRIISGYVGGLPGIHAMWSGSDWHWHKTVNRNDEITTEAWLKDLILHDTKFAGRAVQQIYHVDFFNQKGDLVAGADSWCF